ncbi:MAG: hypothetical protein KAH30_03015 [Caldisericia bacterium]|nr:hypothetical protein [Caldisericia bacterium]
MEALYTISIILVTVLQTIIIITFFRMAKDVSILRKIHEKKFNIFVEKKLIGLKWTSQWTSYIGSLHGCSEHLDLNNSLAWICGATGHAFIINIEEGEICPSGATAWDREALFRLSKNIGCLAHTLNTKSKNPELEKNEIWDFVTNAINKNIPLFVWKEDVSEYCIIYGYSENRFFYSGYTLGDEFKIIKGSRVNRGFSADETGCEELTSISQCKSLSDLEVVKEGIEYALKHSTSRDYIFEGYFSGIEGYDVWISTLNAGEANYYGMSYNTAVWFECRKHAVDFLIEAKTRLDGKANTEFDKAIEIYSQIRDSLKKVADEFPFETKQELISDKNKISIGVKYLKQARDAEEKGLEALADILEMIT